MYIIDINGIEPRRAVVVNEQIFWRQKFNFHMTMMSKYCVDINY